MPAQELENQETQNYEPIRIKTILAWTAPGRPFSKKSKQYYATSLLIMLLIEIILFLFSQYILMAVVLSLVFLAFALASVPPRDFHYRISSEGITVEDRFFLWQELYDFYFRRKETFAVYPVNPNGLIITPPKKVVFDIKLIEPAKR